MQAWDQVKVKNDDYDTRYARKAGLVIKVDKDQITVKLDDYADAVTFDNAQLDFLGR